MIRMAEAEALAAGVPFPSTPADEAERERLEKRRKRASDVALGKVAMNARERAKMQRRADQKRGWRVLVPAAVQEADLCFVLAVDPGARGGWACWLLGSQPIFFDTGDLPAPLDDWRPTLVVLEDRIYVPGRGFSGETKAATWGSTAAALESVCRERGWPMIAVEPRTWQACLKGLPRIGCDLTTKGLAHTWVATNLGRRVPGGWDLTDVPIYGPRGGYIDGRGDAIVIAGGWAIPHLTEILAECAKGVGS